MKRWIGFSTLVLALLLLAPAVLGVRVSAATEEDSYRQARLQELFDLYARYRAKEDATGEGENRTSELLWDEHLTPLSKLTGADATDRALIDLICQKGYAMAPLSWIYHTSADLHGVPAVEDCYREGRVQILSHAVGEEGLDAFFLGSAEAPPQVYACYTALLNAIYTQRLAALAKPDDSARTQAILTAATCLLREGGADPSLDLQAPAFCTLADEDGAPYASYLAQVSALLEQQRNRDAAKEQLIAATYALYPDDIALSIEALAEKHGAIGTFQAGLDAAVTVPQMNALLLESVIALIDSRAQIETPRARAYLQETLKKSVGDCVALALGAIPAPRIPDLAVACFGEDFRLRLAIAEGKDALQADADALSALGEELSSILSDYLTAGGRLDSCTDETALGQELARARLRMSWLAEWGDFLVSLDAALYKYTLPASASLLRQSALALYGTADGAIRDGDRAGTEALEQDRIQLRALIRDAEILSYQEKHPLLSADPDTADREDLALLAAAVSDARTLSEEALADALLRRNLLSLGAMYRRSAQDAVTHRLSRVEGAGETLRVLNDLRTAAAEALRRAIGSLAIAAADGTPDPVALMAQADRLLARTEEIGAFLERCGEASAACPPVYYRSAWQTLCADVTDILLQTDDGADTVAQAEEKLARLEALESLRAMLEPHGEISGVAELIAAAESALLPQSTQPPQELSVYRDQLVDLLRERIRAHARSCLQAVYDGLAARSADYSADNRQALQTAYENARQRIADYALSGDYSDTARLLTEVEEVTERLREIRLDRLDTASASQYGGSIFSPNGFTAKTVFSIFASPRSVKELTAMLQSAVKDGQILRADGSALAKELYRAMLRCQVSLALTVQARNAPDPAAPYTVSIRLPETVDRTQLLGILRRSENGAVSFYEIGGEGDTVIFTTDGFDEYYLVSRRVVSLLPWILLLCGLLLAEGGILTYLYRRRRRGVSLGASLCLMPPCALSVSYSPQWGPAAVVLLGIAALGLGAWIATLLISEARAAKQRVRALPEAAPRLLPEAEERALVSVGAAVEGAEGAALPPPAAPVPLPRTMARVSAEEAQILMSDSDAKRQRSQDYVDREVYRGARRAQVNLDTIAQAFEEGETVHLNALKERRLVDRNVGFVKILARGTLDKPLTVVAQDFSTAALKMILLTGGTPVVTYASPERERQRSRA